MSELIYLEVDRKLASRVEELIETAPNPYSCEDEIARNLATAVLALIERSRSDASNALMRLIEHANASANLQPIHLRCHVTEPAGSLLPPHADRGFDYGNSERDRLKRHFHTEWLCWVVALLLNCDSVTHPSEHGGGKRFHLVSPLPSGDGRLRDAGASTGGGEFHPHSDATIHHELTSESAVEHHLESLGISLDIIAATIGRPASSILAQMMCGRFLRVDATLLANVVNGSTRTHVGTTLQLESHLRRCGFSVEQLRRLACMPVAHIAGPADGDISNFVGAVQPPLHLDAEGGVIGTRINAAPGRMFYVGVDAMDGALFEKFVDAVRVMPVHEVLLKPGDVLFLPNAHFAQQRNVTHGRGRLSDDEYKIDIGHGVFARRTHVRQYAQSRLRNGKRSFLESVRSSGATHGI